MLKSDAVHHPESGISTTRIIVLVAILAVFAGVIWYTGVRIRALNRELAASEQRAEQVNERLREYSRELEMALDRASVARQRTTDAESEAEDAQAARQQAEHEAEQAVAQKETALRRAAEAQAETQQSREELEKMRQRREEELNRMQSALNKIAPTKRTPAGMVVMLSDDHFQFDFDKATLKPKNRELLSRVAGILLASEGYRLFVDGHTDDIGSADYNKGLSERRATTVRDYLVNAGLPENAIETNGFGQSQPLVKAATKEARAKNRRVEIGIVDTIVHYQTTMRKK